MASMTVFKKFNTTYFSFLDFIKKHIQNDLKFNGFYMKNLIIKSTNIKLLIKTWYNRITSKYYAQVMNKDLEFFMNKTYIDDVNNNNTSGEAPDVMLIYISDFKKAFPTLDESIKNEFTDYIMKLTNYSYIYFNG
jgi:hypothetical protein